MISAPNIGNVLTQTAARHGDAVGLIHGEQRWSWAELEAQANALARALLALGIGPGDRVAVLGVNHRSFYQSMYAITRTGAVYVPLNPRAALPEVVQMVGLCQARALIVDAALADRATAAAATYSWLAQVIVVDGHGQDRLEHNWHDYDRLLARHAGGETVSHPVKFDDVAWHNFTSGTTGVPKGALNSHGTLMYALLNRLAETTPGLGPADCLLAVAWIGHGTGTMTLANTLVGGRIVLTESKGLDPAEVWRLIAQHRVSAMFVVPTILTRLLDAQPADADLSSLAHVVLTGAAIARPDLDLAIQRLGPALVQYYGAVEAVGAGTVLRPGTEAVAAAGPQARYAIGWPRIASELRLADEALQPVAPGEIGEICLRGPGVFSGYFEDPAANAAVFQNGWYRTGDLGREGPGGLIHLAGRRKEMFKSGGLQVYPNEIQDHLARHPAVAEAHVLPLPDRDLGEIGVAVVRLVAAATAVDAAEQEATLQTHLAQHLARYKLPRRIFIVDDVPRSANGKVPKSLLAQMLAEQGLITPGEDVARAANPIEAARS